MERKDLLQSSEYWITKIQIDLYNCAEHFMKVHNMNRTELAKYLGVTKGYVTQLLSGDYNHSLSKLVELSLAFGFVPEMEFTSVQEAIIRDNLPDITKEWRQIVYQPASKIEIRYEDAFNDYKAIPSKFNKSKKCA